MIYSNLNKRIFTSIILLILLYLIFKYNILLVYSVLVIGTLAILEFINIVKRIFKKKFFGNFINFFFILFVFSFSYLFLFFTMMDQIKILVFIIFLGCIASDIGGFIAGKIFKGPKLTRISPNKTISGAFGSLFLTIITMTTLFYLIKIDLKIAIIIISIITSILCQLGDLFFSYLKRKAKLKDTGKFLPGHGGVLDRLDGIFLGLPGGFISLIVFY